MAEKDDRLAQEVVARAEAHLAGVQPTPRFSPEAFAGLKTEIGRYVNELINESLEQAKRQRLDTVSEPHVERASSYLASRTTPSKSSRFWGLVGGILLGAAASRLFVMSAGGTYSGTTIAVTAGAAALGALIIGLTIFRD